MQHYKQTVPVSGNYLNINNDKVHKCMDQFLA